MRVRELVRVASTDVLDWSFLRIVTAVINGHDGGLRSGRSINQMGQ